MTASFTHDQPGTPASAWRGHPAARACPELELDRFDRLVVLAAHPDDETLGAGGLIATAHTVGLEVEVLVATAGERSHPRSPTLGPIGLARRRLAELEEAVGVLAPGSSCTFLGLADAEVALAESTLVERVVEVIGDGRRTLVLAPWRHDGHSDHEAAGRAAGVAAARTDATLLEFPIWWWHWARPESAPWERMCRFALSDEAQQRRSAAIRSHRSQIQPLSAEPGDEALLTREVLEHFRGESEYFVSEDTHDDALETLHARAADPWGVRDRWYERRKRDLLLAALPWPRFGRALEVGCSIGELTVALAERCDQVVAVDSSEAAVRAARERLAGTEVEVIQARVPREWVDGRFDLVVLSEIGYFLSPAGLDGLLDRITSSLSPRGTIVLCHWRHEVDGWPMDGPAVHAAVRDRRGWVEHASYVDRDVEIVVLGADAAWPEPHA
ncbi:LmbE family N-acetylglucosaminyl deacetylase [Mumia flava]|uniref:LmbE family N-acetylglucosaminyl deacetylase n=1 Tax=Mumia flava TaxID=1348852 RepID=A0A0B2B2W9_9ACTN|nr:PIG-L family deacetylase [Mumia flava]PJJ56145.1 LmbE family N-acetylglucosaminyl deacetylase [Mumia flava]